MPTITDLSHIFTDEGASMTSARLSDIWSQTTTLNTEKVPGSVRGTCMYGNETVCITDL